MSRNIVGLASFCEPIIWETGTTMSEYTREELLKLIQENSGPEKLDLSGKDLSGIDLNERAIGTELE